MSTYLEDQVKQAAKELDTYRPGWEEKIAVEELQMTSLHNCILGMIYGSYSQAPEELKRRYYSAFSSRDSELVWPELLDKRDRKAKKKIMKRGKK